MAGHVRRLVDVGVLRPEETDALSLYPGDLLRLKFAFPNGQVEVLDADLLSFEVLLESEGTRTEWVVIRMDGRIVWKPIAYLAQIEVLRANAEARQRLTHDARKPEPDGYHG